MSDLDFDRAALLAIFNQTALVGWRRLSLGEAARDAGLPLDRMRLRFPDKMRALIRLGRLVDALTLEVPVEATETPRDRLFDLLMRRYEALQPFRPGIVALLRGLVFDPGAALALGMATTHSMGWLLEGAGLASTGLIGMLRVQGLTLVWLAGLRAWERDESEDLTATMAAVDTALARAEQAARWLDGSRGAVQGQASSTEPLDLASETVELAQDEP